MDNAASSTHAPSGRFFQDDTALNRVLLEAPYLARCSDNKTATRVRPREFALRYPYMQVNQFGRVSWLIFDLDHANALLWDDLGLPAPNLVVRNRNNGHSHLYYAIHPVLTRDDAREKPILYMKAVYRAYAERLKADPAYSSGPVSKTPGHPWWETSELHNHVYELGDLADYVDLSLPRWKPVNLEDSEHSRHCILFDRLRYFAYSIVDQEREGGSFSHFVSRLEAFAHNSNDFSRHGFSQNLPLSSLRATVRSVSRWTWDVYRGGGRCHRGVMELSKNLPLSQRQSLAAKRTHEIRNKATESKIRAACSQLKAKGEKLRQGAIALIAGVTRQTVAAYTHVLKEPLLTAATALREKVKHAARQIPAPAVCFSGSNNQALGLGVDDAAVVDVAQEVTGLSEETGQNEEGSTLRPG
jgi:hypothetical protein